MGHASELGGGSAGTCGSMTMDCERDVSELGGGEISREIRAGLITSRPRARRM